MVNAEPEVWGLVVAAAARGSSELLGTLGGEE